MRMRILTLAICATVLALCGGCNKKGPTTDTEEEKHPLIMQGQNYMESRDYNKAEEAFQQALIANPYMARPHLDLAKIYHEHKPDYISSIYHYKRYMDLRPESEKLELIQEQIQDVQGKLAEAILQQTGGMRAIQDFQRVQNDYQRVNRELTTQKNQVDSLKRQLADLQIKLAKQNAGSSTSPAAASSSSTAARPVTTEPATTASGEQEIYHVVAGDNLYKIAKKVYGNSTRWKDIYEANKDRMKSEGDLRVGQSLLIPK
jgi:tetratricopeptide (TPR) repeat protein